MWHCSTILCISLFTYIIIFHFLSLFPLALICSTNNGVEAARRHYMDCQHNLFFIFRRRRRDVTRRRRANTHNMLSLEHTHALKCGCGRIPIVRSCAMLESLVCRKFSHQRKQIPGVVLCGS